MSKNNEQPMDLFDRVDLYLHDVWDPIGVRAFGDGEYSDYVDDIVLMIIRKVKLKELANHLQMLVEVNMGIEFYPRNFHVESAYDLLKLRDE
jgi:hypothetical protein